MSGRLGRRSGAVFCLAIALVALAPAGPASAADGPVIVIDQPTANQVVDTANVTVSGKATVDLPLFVFKSVVLTIGDKTFSPPCPDSPCAFAWKVALPLNGPYEVKVAASEKAILLGTDGPTGSQTRPFAVAAPPAKPVLDPPHVTDARTVELTWSRNTEPDLLYYAVFRKDPAGAKFLQIGGKVAQPTSGKSVTFTDTTTTFNGGDFSYQVVAVRKGASGTAATEKSSDPSTPGLAAIPPPPTTTTTAPLPGTAVGGSTTTVKPGPPAGVDLNGFLSSRSTPTPLAPITVPELPDTGYQSTLPFGARPPGDDVEEGDAEATPPTVSRRSTSIISVGRAGRPLVPVAAGLILLMLAMHVRLLNRRLKPEAAGELPVDLVVPAGPAAAPDRAAHARPEPDPQPEARFYDVVRDAGWVPAPELEPEPEAEPDVLWAADFDLDAALDAPPQNGHAPDHAPEPEDEVPLADPDAIEVFEVVSPTRRRLVRSGSR